MSSAWCGGRHSPSVYPRRSAAERACALRKIAKALLRIPAHIALTYTYAPPRLPAPFPGRYGLVPTRTGDPRWVSLEAVHVEVKHCTQFGRRGNRRAWPN